ncbi:hypothetical protein Dimus_020698, partial [Dionaea muscipula]
QNVAAVQPTIRSPQLQRPGRNQCSPGGPSSSVAAAFNESQAAHSSVQLNCSSNIPLIGQQASSPFSYSPTPTISPTQSNNCRAALYSSSGGKFSVIKHHARE